MIELNINIVELRELRKALGQQIRTIDCVAEERRPWKWIRRRERPTRRKRMRNVGWRIKV